MKNLSEEELVVKKLSKKNDLSRRWRSFKKHSLTTVIIILLSMMVVIFWKYLKETGRLCCEEADQETIRMMIATLWVVYTIPAALLLMSDYKKFTRIGVSVLAGDERSFFLYRDQRQPVLLHIYLGSLSFFIMASTIMFLNFKSQLFGGWIVFITAFIMLIFWAVLFHLENPTRGHWLIERVPSKWLEKDVDVYFGFEDESEES